MEYDKNKHLQLLKAFSNLDNPKKFLSTQEFINYIDNTTSIPENEFDELTTYSWLMRSHLHWENRHQYFKLIENMLASNSPMNFLPLKKKYESINEAVKQLEAKFILFEPNSEGKNFGILIDDLMLLFLNYCPDRDFCESQEFDEPTLRGLIQDIFLEMKNRYP